MRDVIRAKGHDRDRSLGHLAVAWTEWFCVHGPGDVQGEKVRYGDEMYAFTVDCYALNESGRMLYDSGFLSRPKGCDKSGTAARFALFEALGPCRFAGWAEGGEVYRDPWGLGFEYTYPAGEPMGRPVRVPVIRCMATEETQTGLVYDTVYLNLTEGPLAEVPGVDAGVTRTNLPGGGEVLPSTASSASKDGGRETFVTFDETHLYQTPELRRMYDTVTRNLRKRKGSAGSWYLEVTTMFAPGQDSVAERTYLLAGQIREGKVKRERLLFDHQWGDCEDLSDEKALRAALRDAYGDAGAWQDFDGLVDECYDVRKAVSDSRRYLLNAPTSASDAWLAHHEVQAAADATKVIADRDVVVLAFDGSRSRAYGVTDATALVGCRVADGHLFEVGVWEQPPGPPGDGWQVPVAEVEAAVEQAFSRWTVVGFFADPNKWESRVSNWEARWGSQLKVKASRDHPCEWWPSGQRAARATTALHSALLDGEATFCGSWALTRHLLNARRRESRAGTMLGKETPESARKIDAAVTATMAWQARLDAVAAGVGQRKAVGFVPRRLQ